MAPIQPGQKRYARLQKALKNAKITQSDFDYCVQNGVAYSTFKDGSPDPAEVPTPSPALLAVPTQLTINPKSSHYDVEAAEESPPPAPRKSRKPRYEPFHGGVILMSLQEKFDALADQVLSETEEGVRMSGELRTKWWGFRFLGG